MIVVSITNCPPRLRGDLSKWLLEINTGVYVGKLSARVRDKLWERICGDIGDGQATMVYSSNNEQGFNYLVCNTTWKPVDFDGIILMKKPKGNPASSKKTSLKPGFSKAYKYNIAAKRNNNVHKKQENYVILDLETTGLDPEIDRIIEIAMIKFIDGKETDRFHKYIKLDKKISPGIQDLTGITDELLNSEGVPEADLIEPVKNFIGTNMVMGYNVNFDVSFIRYLFKRYSDSFVIIKDKDIMNMARRKLYDITNFKLETVAKYFSLDTSGHHSAMFDCELAQRILCKLNEI